MQYIRTKQLAELLSVHPTTIWRYRKRKDFPKPIQLSPAAIAWSRDEVLIWLEQNRASY